MLFGHHPLEVDGGVNVDTASACVAAGANILTSGSFIFTDSDGESYAGAVQELRRTLSTKWKLAT